MKSTAPRSRVSRSYCAFCAGMAVLFVISAAVQWNDPDPVLWMLFYGLAALTAAAAPFDARAQRGLEIVLAGVAAAVVIAFLPALGDARVEAVSSFEMKSPEDEEFRELGGATLVLGFAAVVLVRRYRLKGDAQ
jgi:hypothetical protein